MSTENAVLDLSDLTLINFNSGKYIVVAFLDLSKAFDTLNRSILFRKLSYYVVNSTALEWFLSYFSQRKQFVNKLDASSPTISIGIGITQGSCPGPLMFFFIWLIFSCVLLKYTY